MNQDSNEPASDSQPEAEKTDDKKSKSRFSSMVDVVSQAKQHGGQIASSAADVAGQAFGAASETTMAAASAAAEAAGQTLGAASETTMAAASAAADAAGQALGVASDTTMSAAGAVGEGFDVVSGKKLLQLIEERLERQMQYNDILATKLEEALRRIADLEEKVQ